MHSSGALVLKLLRIAYVDAVAAMGFVVIASRTYGCSRLWLSPLLLLFLMLLIPRTTLEYDLVGS